MKHRRKARLTRQQILDCFRWIRSDAGEGITVEEFVDRTGVPLSQVRQHFGNWAGLREELGLPPRARIRKRYSDDDILRQFHESAERLGRFPTIREFDAATGVSTTTLYRRFGPLAKVEQRYREWLRRQHWPEPTGYNRQVDANPPRDVVWLRNRWFNLRVGFELRSSDFKGREPDACDFLVVLEHDWPACPVRVLELHQALLPGDS
jgi:hypothetical protein